MYRYVAWKLWSVWPWIQLIIFTFSALNFEKYFGRESDLHLWLFNVLIFFCLSFFFLFSPFCCSVTTYQNKNQHCSIVLRLVSFKPTSLFWNVKQYFSDENSLKLLTFLTNNFRSCKCHDTKKAWSITKPRTYPEQKFVWIL